MNEAQKLISEHQLVNIDNYIYVVDGVCVVIEPDSLDFTDVRQLHDLFLQMSGSYMIYFNM